MATPAYIFLHENTPSSYVLYPQEKFAASMFLEPDSLLFHFFFSKQIQIKLVKSHKIVNTEKSLKLKENEVLNFVQIFIGLNGTLHKVVSCYRDT